MKSNNKLLMDYSISKIINGSVNLKEKILRMPGKTLQEVLVMVRAYSVSREQAKQIDQVGLNSDKAYESGMPAVNYGRNTNPKEGQTRNLEC